MDGNTIFQGTDQAPAETYQEENIQRGFPFMKIAKILIALFFVIALILVVTKVILPRFGGEQNGKVNLVYWGLWEDSRTMKPIIDEFQRENPNVSIEYSKYDISQYRLTLDTRLRKGTGPDIFRFHNSWYPMFSDLLLPLSNDVVTKNDFNKNFYPVVQKDLIKNGAIYGIPLEIDTLALYVNNDLLSAAGVDPPSTWEEFTDRARLITVKDESGKIKTAGAAIGTWDNIDHAPDILSLLFLQNGVDFSDFSKQPENAAGALDFYTSFALGEDKIWDNTLDSSARLFASGNLGMYFGYSWDYFTIKAINPNLNFSIVPVPQLPGQKINMASYWSEGVSLKSKHPKEALLFMKFLAKKETAEKKYTEEAKTRLFGEPYARKDLAGKLKEAPAAVFVDQANSASSSFFVGSTFDEGLNNDANGYLSEAVIAILNNTSSQTAFETLSNGISQVLGNYEQKK